MNVLQILTTPTYQRSTQNEIEAVAADERRMLFRGILLEDLNDPDSDEHRQYRSLLHRCEELGLVVTLRPHSTRSGVGYVDVFITKPQNVTLVDQLISLHRAFESRPWTEGAEVLQSTLLGYDQNSIDEWITYRRLKHVCWGLQTIYLRMNDEQRDCVITRGSHYLPVESLNHTMYAFHIISDLTVRSDALEIWKGFHIARFAARFQIVEALFGKPPFLDKPVIVSHIDRTSERAINRLIESSIQFFDGSRFIESRNL